ncbi:hypothetical protein RHMOL_Rhmol13G0095400 [Rhododendron molle]|uniref:Uncharacterized protein n=1 Tax=Rhododendron molle TaxID=49168 RepID=A0ACC0L6D4_RHOML|nr:hypothetical protein RHMOL_Rhmol13G0095400 [Rhododendron molle]
MMGRPIWDNEGQWIVGFHKKFQSALSSTMGGMLGNSRRPQIALDRSLSGILAEPNSPSTTQLITDDKLGNHELSN